MKNLAHASDFRRFCGGAVGAGAGDKNVDLAPELARGGDAFGDAVGKRLVVVVGDDEDGH